MKSLSTTKIMIAFLGCMSVTLSAQTTEKMLVKSFNLQGMQSLLLQLDGPVEVQEWNKDIVRIQMNISLSNGNENILKALIKARRYNLDSKIQDSDFVVFSPSIDKEVSVGGVMMKEKISYSISAPRNVSVRVADTATSQQSAVATPSSL